MDKAPPQLRSHGFCNARLNNHQRLHQALGYRTPRQVLEEGLVMNDLAEGQLSSNRPLSVAQLG
jgi:hypothetical protein